MVIAPTPTMYPASAIEALNLICKVDHVDATTVLIVEEPMLPPV